MTVVHFRNAHLVYALTRFSLAALAAFGAWRVGRDKPRALKGLPVKPAG